MIEDMDKIFMVEAFKQAKRAFEADEVPVGAVIVHTERIVARAHNQVEMLKDPTAHAEMIALTQATNTLQFKWLQDCCLYVTLEPCCMCAGALVLARIGRVCFGAADPKSGACGSVFNIAQTPALNHQCEILGGVLAEECAGLLTSFFGSKRLEGKK